MYKLLFSWLLIFGEGTFIVVNSQAFQITGKIIDGENKSPLSGVSIILTGVKDSLIRTYDISDSIGNFKLIAPRRQIYKITASYLGYRKIERVIEVKNTTENLGSVFMFSQNKEIKEIIIQGPPPAAIQKGDTTEMNAEAYKTKPDATAEDLVTKMPTITIDNSGVKAQGENVQQVLVDGKPFFGDDPMIALRNLPAEVIDKIQVFNKLSDQAELTGFDDGQTTKTLNIITKKNRRNGIFGKIYGGYGTDEDYQAGGNLNFFNNDRRISIIGLSNNINQQNFSTQDLLGVTGNSGGGRFGGGQRGGGPGGGGFAGRSGGGGFGGYGGNTINNFLVGQQNGISTTNSFGLNYSDTWSKNFKINGSYFFNDNSNVLEQSDNRQYANTSQMYNEQDTAKSRNYNNRLNFRIEYAIDSMNSLIMVPKLSFQFNKQQSSQLGVNFLNGNIISNRSDNFDNIDANGYSLSNDLTFRHKFEKRGRTISLYVNTSDSHKNSNSDLTAQNFFYDNNNSQTDSIDQETNALTKGYSIASNLMYTEPLGKTGLLQFNYGYSFSKNNADKLTYDMLHFFQGSPLLDTTLSNTYDNDYATNRAGIGYRLRGKSFYGSFTVNYQRADLTGSSLFPTNENVDRTFENILPSLMLNFRFTDKNNLRVIYRASTNAPTISQLQNVIDNSNPLMLSTGNPDLKQEFSHNLITRFSFANPEKSTNFFGFLYAAYTLNSISSLTYTAFKDTIFRGADLKRGARITMPVNLDNNWNVRSLFTYGFPLNFAKCNMNLNTGFNYARNPGELNDRVNVSNSYTVAQGIVLSSNISENIDFTLSYTGNYNIAKNSIESSMNNNYFYHTANFKLNWIFWQGIVFQSDVTNQFYRGLSSSNYNQNYILINVGLGKKLFKQQGEIRASVFDLLNQNNNINRNITGTYIEDTKVNVLRRYIMLTFTYNLKKFSEG